MFYTYYTKSSHTSLESYLLSYYSSPLVVSGKYLLFADNSLRFMVLYIFMYIVRVKFATRSNTRDRRSFTIILLLFFINPTVPVSFFFFFFFFLDTILVHAIRGNLIKICSKRKISFDFYITKLINLRWILPFSRRWFFLLSVER